MLGLLAAAPVAGAMGHRLAAEIVVNVALLLLLLVSGVSACRAPALRAVVIVLTLLAAAFRIGAILSDSVLPEAGTYLTALLVVATVATITIRELLTGRQVTHDKLSASICAYGFIAIFWAVAYSLLELQQPGSFQFLSADAARHGMRFGFGESTEALYFSLVTITTLGYGDIVPVSDTARLMAATEAFLGQVYIAVLVARLVGLHIATSEGREKL